MSRYAPYAPDAPARPPLDAAFRRATPDDAEAIAAISAERNGVEPGSIVDKVRRALERSPAKVWVAERDGSVLAFAKVTWIDAAVEAQRAEVRNVADGYYLTGLVVEPGSRRAGLGRALTRLRLDWIEAQGGTEVFYRVNTRNLTSVDLHAEVGFEEVSRDTFFASMPSLPGETYALCRAPLQPRVPLRVGVVPERGQVEALYQSVGWTVYTDDLDKLMRALAGSTWLATRWSGDELVALCRVVSDDASIAYLQDVLVRPDHQRHGLGRALVQLALDRFAHLRQFLLLTDDRPKQLAFYESLGLRNTADGSLNCFVRIP